MPNEQEALQANELFYRAFNERDIELMARIWDNDPLALCIHPGWEAICGYSAILKSWVDIFHSGEGLELSLSDVKIVVSHDLAWVNCQENLFSMSLRGVHASRVHATNLYRRTHGTWRMILHHASAVPQILPE
ncbi:MAG: DUF4440 domain-containing protein [Nitrospinae bacterium CG11_big_fil_rev_8_21_14_0_20_56_8]|nr:MAG: DUF4440 domain-containing protein [Nitrospinae bacterium CG11_big_fil_rev_8_21_14_0_20_56_8]